MKEFINGYILIKSKWGKVRVKKKIIEIYTSYLLLCCVALYRLFFNFFIIN